MSRISGSCGDAFSAGTATSSAPGFRRWRWSKSLSLRSWSSSGEPADIPDKSPFRALRVSVGICDIRELQNVIERGVIMTTGPILARQTTANLTPIAVGSGSIKTLAEAERAHITATLRETNWVVGGPRGAASQLGMPRTSLISRMQRLGISGRASRCRPARTTQRLVRVIGGLSSRLKDDSTTGVPVLEAASSQIKENQR